jgi:uncharacterized membrane protein
MAGIFFTWSNAVKPGIGKLSDLEYLRTFQSMNRVILKNTFKIIFSGAIITTGLLPIFYFNLYPNNIFWMFISAFIIYWIGAFIVTIIGNIPLNELLDKTSLESISLEELKTIRTSIEVKWNNFNLIRSISSVVSFTLLIVSILLINK